MDSILTLKEQLQNIYAKNSRIIDKLIRFAVALVTFYAISKNIGFMHALANPVITIGISAVCAFLPDVFTVIAAAAVALLHIYSFSAGMAIVTAILFFLMFAFYLRLAPKTAIVVVLMPVAFMLHIPAVVPIGFALVCAPSCIVSAALGTMAYYIVGAVKKAAAATQAEETGLITDMMDFAKKFFQNKEMWMMMVAAVLCMLVVYGVKRAAIAHAWKVASVAGAAVYLIVGMVGGTVFGFKASSTSMIVGAVVAVLVGLVLEVLFFAVDYTRCESLQYEDDDYYYYVKAVPKIRVAAPEETVKEINKRGEFREQAEVIDAQELARRPKKPAANRDGQRTGANRKSGQQGRRPDGAQKKRPVSRKNDLENADQLLLTQSLKKDLNIKDR